MPRADFFKDRPEEIRWIPGKAKGSNTASGREYKEYSQCTTTRDFYARYPKLFVKHFTHDLKKGIFEFVEDPWRELQQTLMREASREARAQATRIREFANVTVAPAPSAGGVELNFIKNPDSIMSVSTGDSMCSSDRG